MYMAFYVIGSWDRGLVGALRTRCKGGHYCTVCVPNARSAHFYILCAWAEDEPSFLFL